MKSEPEYCTMNQKWFRFVDEDPIPPKKAFGKEIKCAHCGLSYDDPKFDTFSEQSHHYAWPKYWFGEAILATSMDPIIAVMGPELIGNFFCSARCCAEDRRG